MGRVGMSRSDFEQCTPLEFSKIVEKNNALEELRIREGWEQTRTQVVAVASLFSKKPINPQERFPLPWDKGNAGKQTAVPKGTSSPERMKEVLGRLKK